MASLDFASRYCCLSLPGRSTASSEVKQPSSLSLLYASYFSLGWSSITRSSPYFSLYCGSITRSSLDNSCISKAKRNGDRTRSSLSSYFGRAAIFAGCFSLQLGLVYGIDNLVNPYFSGFSNQAGPLGCQHVRSSPCCFLLPPTFSSQMRPLHALKPLPLSSFSSLSTTCAILKPNECSLRGGLVWGCNPKAKRDRVVVAATPGRGPARGINDIVSLILRFCDLFNPKHQINFKSLKGHVLKVLPNLLRKPVCSIPLYVALGAAFILMWTFVVSIRAKASGSKGPDNGGGNTCNYHFGSYNYIAGDGNIYDYSHNNIVGSHIGDGQCRALLPPPDSHFTLKLFREPVRIGMIGFALWMLLP